MLKLKICFLTEAELCVLPGHTAHFPSRLPAAFPVLRWWQEETLSGSLGPTCSTASAFVVQTFVCPGDRLPKILSQQIRGWLSGKEGWTAGFRGRAGGRPLRLGICDSLVGQCLPPLCLCLMTSPAQCLVFGRCCAWGLPDSGW